MTGRLNHFDVTLEHTAGKEFKFTDFISRNPTKNPEPEENYDEELVINAIAQLPTLKIRKGQIFNQSDGANAVNEANMLATRSLKGTRRFQTNKGQTNSDYGTQQLYNGKNPVI